MLQPVHKYLGLQIWKRLSAWLSWTKDQRLCVNKTKPSSETASHQPSGNLYYFLQFHLQDLLTWNKIVLSLLTNSWASRWLASFPTEKMSNRDRQGAEGKPGGPELSTWVAHKQSLFYNLHLMFPGSQKGQFRGIPGFCHPRTWVTLKPGDIQDKRGQQWVKGWETKHSPLSAIGKLNFLRAEHRFLRLRALCAAPDCCVWAQPCSPSVGSQTLVLTPPLSPSTQRLLWSWLAPCTQWCPQDALPYFSHSLTPWGKGEEKKFGGLMIKKLAGQCFMHASVMLK